jgi:hypothetical protein
MQMERRRYSEGAFRMETGHVRGRTMDQMGVTSQRWHQD